ncbi:ubiquitinyl hydrolase [Hysterangium stoloniferum]|nr:ubiquitinyl hydrolase [Hysterangium stoloniferum]
MSCAHLHQLSRIPSPRLSQSVHREECTQCFDNQDLPEGIDVCLSCFNGGCVGDDATRRHAQLHYGKLGHPFSLNVRRKLKPNSKRVSQAGPPLKKLAIVEEREEDKYEFMTTLRCWACYGEGGRLLPEESHHPEVKRLSTDVMGAMSSARQSEIKAWEEEITPCTHTTTLQPQGVHVLESGVAHCSKCDLKDNLWMCLTCGALGCGRSQYGGVGGNSHGLAHNQETGHPVAVKLGTITPEGNADIFCYACGDSKLDSDLARHLSAFGINIATQTKTEKSMTELQIEQNLKFDFSLTGEDGKALEPVFGPGLTGLSNLGNSCYMASTLQSVFALPAFRTYYLPSFLTHARTCPEQLPASCIDCQMRKMADGLLSGRYSHPRSHFSSHAAGAPVDVVEPMTMDADPLVHLSSTSAPAPVFQEGIKPTMFKSLIGKGHEEFSTMKQQDAEEFFAHLLKVLRQQAKKRAGASEPGPQPADVFRFGMEQRLQCMQCRGVRYRVDEHDDLSAGVPALEAGRDAEGKVLYQRVKLRECVGDVMGEHAVEYTCPRCEVGVVAQTRARFATFPDVLVVHAKKFQLVSWVPTKLDIPVDLPDEDVLVLDEYIASGLQPDETPLPDETEAPSLPTFNAAALAALEGMGFPTVRCQKALLATGNSDAEAAMEWLFGHMEDPDIDDPIVLSKSAGTRVSGPEPSAEQVAMMEDMGFTTAQARKALRETSNNPERAIEWLFSHPDDTGLDDAPGPAPASAQSPKIHGSTTLPAKYRLKAFISHKGPSVHSGHYVAHIRTETGGGAEEGWVLFNDEKVVKAERESVRELKALAYLYLFEKV